MKDFLKKELYSLRAVTAILARWLLLAVPTGLVCGAVGTAFHLAVEHVTEWRGEHVWLLWLLPLAGLAIVALYKLTGCEGMGTNNVIRAVHSGESVSPLLVPAIFLGTVLTHLCGGSAGREGAALQMGGSIGYNIARLFHFSDHDRRTATACGMAAFFSALFGTPLAATLFGIMVEDVGLAFSVAFVPGFAAALIAYGVSLACGIAPTHFGLTAPALSIDTALLAAVLGAAWLAAPHVLDWATHTWYTVVKNRDLEAESASRAAASSEAAASSAVQEAASSQPEPEQPKELDGKAVTGGSWAAVDVSTLADDAAIRAAAQQLKAQGADYGLVTLKTPDGSICYASQVPAAAQSIAGTTVDPARIAAIFREEGVIPVAQLAAFKDPISSRTDRSMAIHYGDGLWLDAQKDGNAWLNPYSAAAVEYVGDLVAEVQGMGFEQVVLTNVQFPKLSRKQDYGETSGVSRADQLKADIAALQSRFAGSMTLWFSYTLDQCNTNSVSLDVPAVTLGMDNLLVTADKAVDADSRTALEQSAAGQGVQHLVLHSADIFQ